MLAFVAHESRMRQPADKEGKVAMRTALRTAAARGNESAAKALHGPELPEPLEYLWAMFSRLDEMRASGFNGGKRFTPAHIRGGMDLFGWTLTLREAETLVQMDAVMLNPEAFEKASKGEE